MGKLILFAVIITVIFLTVLMSADSVIRMMTDIRKTETEEENVL